MAWERIGDVAKPRFQNMWGVKGTQTVIWVDNWSRGNWAVVLGRELPRPKNAPQTFVGEYEEKSTILNVGNKSDAVKEQSEYRKEHPRG